METPLNPAAKLASLRACAPVVLLHGGLANSDTWEVANSDPCFMRHGYYVRGPSIDTIRSAVRAEFATPNLGLVWQAPLHAARRMAVSLAIYARFHEPIESNKWRLHHD